MIEYKVDSGPHIRSSNSTKKIMMRLLISLLPIIIFGFYKNGIMPFLDNKTNILGMFRPIIIVLVSCFTSIIGEVLFNILFLKKKDSIKDTLLNSYGIFPGLFLSLIVPINTPISIVIFGSLVSTVIGKMLFGGFGNNIFNPALIGRLFVITCYSKTIMSLGGYLNPLELDTISSSTPLSNAGIYNGIGSYKELISPYGSLLNFLIGTIPGAIGETSSILCILAFIYLSITKVIKWKIPVVYVGTVFMITWMIGGYHELGIWYPVFQVLSGGLLFGAVFMATDPVTSPVTSIGQILYGLFLGILTVTFRYLTPYPEGVLTSILTMNMFVSLLDKVGSKSRFDFNKSMWWFITSWLLILVVGMYINLNSNKTSDNKDPNFDIISREEVDNKITYIATQKGYSSNIKAEVVIMDNNIKSYTILDQNDSFFSRILDSNYINTLLKNQNKLDNVDTISGATISSNAVKQLLINVIKDSKIEVNAILDNENVHEEKEENKDFSVVEKDVTNNIATYVVKGKGFSGEIKARIVINNGEVKSFVVLEESDSYYNKITEEGYINKLIYNQSNIQNYDTVSGATITSTALKNILINTLEDYNRGE